MQPLGHARCHYAKTADPARRPIKGLSALRAVAAEDYQSGLGAAAALERISNRPNVEITLPVRWAFRRTGTRRR